MWELTHLRNELCFICKWGYYSEKLLIVGHSVVALGPIENAFPIGEVFFCNLIKNASHFSTVRSLCLTLGFSTT